MQLLHKKSGSEELLNNKEIGFVAVYFNIAGYTALRRNFERFIERFSWLGDRLLIVELAYFSRDFEMTGRHPNILQLRGDSVMWHKENLMNIGTRRLRKQGFKNVGWLDGDAIIDGDPEEWYRKCAKSLDKYNLVQVAEKIIPRFSDYEKEKYLAAAEYFLTDQGHWQCYTAGLGWVMRGELWDNCQYYERSILGAGDCLNFVGALPKAVDFNRYRGFKYDGAKNEMPFYLDWAQRWRNEIQGKIYFVPGVTSSVEPHGDREGRAYQGRAEGLISLGFNPLQHLRPDHNKVLQWTEKASPALRQFCLEYFINRKEDN